MVEPTMIQATMKLEEGQRGFPSREMVCSVCYANNLDLDLGLLCFVCLSGK